MYLVIRTVEAEITVLLTNVLTPESLKKNALDLAAFVERRSTLLGGCALVETTREPIKTLTYSLKRLAQRNKPIMPAPQTSTSQISPLSSYELELLKQEYFFLQTIIEDYNKQIWLIKALGITGTGAVITLALQQNQPLIPLLGIAIPIFFWILESQWKHFQRGFYPRVAKIEKILQQDCGLQCPAIYTEWSHTFKRAPISNRKGYLWDGLLNPSVFISYILEIAFLLLVYQLDIIPTK